MIMTDSMKNPGVFCPPYRGQDNATEGIPVRNFKRQESKNLKREEAHLSGGCVALFHKQHLTLTPGSRQLT